MWLWRKGELEQFDQAGYTVVDALTYVKSPAKVSAFTPHLFVCMDGRKYWIKHNAQHGLVSELVAGRLAARVEAGPEACIVRVPPEAIEGTGLPPELAGVRVGSLDVPNAVNSRDLETVGVTDLDPKKVNAADRARVVVFQSWIGAADSQVMLDMTSGRILSVDHGDVFASTGGEVTPTPVVTGMPGIDHRHGCKADFIEEAVERVESMDDDVLLRAVASVPLGENWRSERSRRLQIARWLAYRRGCLREGMKAWT